MTRDGELRFSRSLVWVAGATGVVHGGFSFYWALGGRWLLAAVIPIAVAYHRMPGRRLWRAVSWVGGSLLVVYGGVNVAVSSAVLLGVLDPEGGYDAVAMRGHALLWDPLFLVWGGTLILSLWFSRAATPIGRTRRS